MSAPKHVKKDFTALAADRLWVADITYVRTEEGFLYLAFVLDAHLKRLAEWAITTHLTAELVEDALRIALWRRSPASELVHYSEQGAQYSL